LHDPLPIELPLQARAQQKPFGTNIGSVLTDNSLEKGGTNSL
jgi:hypothetical protein